MSLLMSKLRNLPNAIRFWVKLVGWRWAGHWFIHRIKVHIGVKSKILRIKPRQAKYPLSIRLNGSSDMDVFGQIFSQDEYHSVLSVAKPQSIIDLGANVGYSSAYFLTAFPKSTLVAVEPDIQNYAQCVKNLAPYGERAKCIHGAVWSKAEALRVSKGAFRDGREWATQVFAGDGDPNDEIVEGWDMARLIEVVGTEKIDLLKIDIEGSEKKLFGENTLPWLYRIKNICIELHGDDCEKAFFSALADYKYDLGYSGELTLIMNMQLSRESN